MATQDIVQEIVKAAISNPNMLSDLMAHPYSTISKLTGIETVTKEQASQAVTATSALASGQSVDFGSLATIAAKLLSSNGNSVHSLASALLSGGMAKAADGGQATLQGALTSKIVENLMGVAFGQDHAKATGPKLDLTDGIGMDDLVAIAGKLLK